MTDPRPAGDHPLGARPLSRRALLGGSAAAVGTALLAAPQAASASGPLLGAPDLGSPTASRALMRSAKGAYEFLDGRVDEYATGSQLRLPRSYQGGFFTTPTFDFVSSFAYDDALVILAYLGRGSRADVRRATVLGDALLFVQANDPIGDGRTRASYQPDTFPATGAPSGNLDIGSPAAYTGNQSWVGMAFARLFVVTGQRRFLDGAVRLGRWIRANATDTTRAPYGFTGGRNADDQPITFKSTEHNIDVTGFFTQLAELTRDASWAADAAIARSFVEAMQDPADGHLWTGTDPDGVTINRTVVPEDVHTWAYLATLDPRYSRALDWVVANLSAVDGPYTGPSYSDTDTSKVWFEGSGHLALCFRIRRAPGDRARAIELFRSIEVAQVEQPNGDGKGVVSASSDGLDTGFGDIYYASLHTGATAWFLLAATLTNPFRLGGPRSR
ncbi:hypothetical protein [Clavibacter zhangzhiyongii]|uniref:hypothetical protein n=1 Tax=Clavibacter TaxID=1573 RepID=UPI0039E080DA